MVIRSLFPVLITLLLLSCDRPECKNTNPIFDRYDDSTKEYKAELINQLNAQPKYLTYWIDMFTENKNRYYMRIHVQGQNLCAKMNLDITESERFPHHKKTIAKPEGGYGYCGAELRGLVYHIDSSNGNYNFIFDDVVWVVD